jgi:hypothetical protein
MSEYDARKAPHQGHQQSTNRFEVEETWSNDAEARILGVEPDGSGSRLTLARGKFHGAIPGMQGYVKGLQATVVITEVTSTRCFATCDIGPAELANRRFVVITPKQRQAVQGRMSGAQSTIDPAATAHAGTANASSPLPHLATIQRAFGRHDLSSVRAQIGGEAVTASTALGASAYAMGDRVAFASTPDLHTAAHEAAHVVQQRRGVGFEGLGSPHDRFEQHADAVADAVVAGHSAEPLFDELAGGAASQAIQRKTEPNDTGVSATELSKAPDIGTVKPAPSDYQFTAETGDRWADHGSFCDGKAQTPICFMSDPQRQKFIVDIKDRILRAGENYKHALQQLRVDELMKKEEDLSWVLSLALDLVGAHIINVAADALQRFKSSAIKKLSEAALDAARHGAYDPTSASATVEAMLAGVSKESISQKVKFGVGTLQKNGAGVIKTELNKEKQTEKAATISFIDQLKTQCDAAFEALGANAAADANDVELQALYDGMDPKFHTINIYAEQLAAKLERFRRSGVTRIGRQYDTDKQWSRIDVIRDTRVVWMKHDNGSKTLWFQSQDGDRDLGVIHKGDPGSDEIFGKTEMKFGARDPREEVHLERQVPDEFRDVALDRSEQIWGATPTIPDPFTAHLHDAKYQNQIVHLNELKRAASAPKQAPKPVVIPDALKLGGKP